MVIKAGINQSLVRIANREDPDQTGSSKEAYLCLRQLSRPFWQAVGVQNFRTFTLV